MIKVLLVDNSYWYKQALKEIIHAQDQIKIIGECYDESEIIAFLNIHTVDVILMDMTTQNINTTLIKERFPFVKIIGFSFYDETIFKEKVLEIGACSFIAKDAEMETIITEIEKCCII